MNCGGCKFFVPDVRPEYSDNGKCHRYPPKLVWIVPELGGRGDWGQDRPYTHKDEFCGEFKLKELA